VLEGLLRSYYARLAHRKNRKFATIRHEQPEQHEWPACKQFNITWGCVRRTHMADNAGLIIVLVSIFACVLASGVGIAFFVGRSSGRNRQQTGSEEQIPARIVKELERCLELREYVSRDANALASTIATQSPPVAGPVTKAIQQLVKTSKNLAGRLGRLGAEARIARPDAGLNVTSYAVSSDVERPVPTVVIPVLTQEEVDAAPAPSDRQHSLLPAGPFDDARRFPRSSFRGSAKATIYPRHLGPGRQPVICEVLTRDLSCGGIGIAHSEQLFPKQIVVLDAVGKLLVGEVRWCRRVDEHFYVAGCRLVKANA
jgi:hypothetical protein